MLITTQQHEAILINVHSLLPAPKPQYIFQVVSSNNSNGELRWKELSKDHKVFYAYHGNRLENFFSIINFGLQQHINKVCFNENCILNMNKLNITLKF